MFCKHCGTSIPQGSAFCPSCGKSQGASVQQTQVIGVPPQMVMMQQPKSLGLAIALTIFFGPLGLLYATVKGGVIMILGGIASWTIFFFTVAMTPAAAIQGGTDITPIGAIFMMLSGFVWPGSSAWACYAVTKYNDNVRRGIINGDVN